MKKTLTAMLAAGTIAVAAFAGASDASARHRGGHGGAVAAGVIGGLAAGAIIGGAIAGSPAYGYPAYGPAPVYVAPAGPGPGCYYTRGRPVWDDYYGTWRRPRVLVAPPSQLPPHPPRHPGRKAGLFCFCEQAAERGSGPQATSGEFP